MSNFAYGQFELTMRDRQTDREERQRERVIPSDADRMIILNKKGFTEAKITKLMSIEKEDVYKTYTNRSKIASLDDFDMKTSNLLFGSTELVDMEAISNLTRIRTDEQNQKKT